MVLFAVRDVVLEIVDARVAGLFHRAHGGIDFAFLFLERLQLAVAIVNDADRGGEAEFQRAFADHQGIVWGMDAAAHHPIDVDVKIGVLRQQLELLVEHLEALLRNFIGHDVVDGDLQVFEPGVIEALDAVGDQQIAVGDHAGDHAAAANARDHQVEIGVQQWFAARDGDDGGAEVGQVVQARGTFPRRARAWKNRRTRCSRCTRGCSGAWG